MESEIWPNIIKQLHKNNLNFTIFNARMSKKIFFFGGKNLILLRVVYLINFHPV